MRLSLRLRGTGLLVGFIPVMLCSLMFDAWVTRVQARAGTWYPKSCCGPADCHPLADGDVEPRHDGYFIKSLGIVVPYDKANTSPNGRYHACTFVDGYNHRAIFQTLNPDSKYFNRSPLCFFAPEKGM